MKQQSTAIRILARTGYIAKGGIYLLIGLLSFQIAIGLGGETSGSTKILKELVYKPFGEIILILCMIGFLAHALWKIINGLFDIEKLGSSFKEIIFRGIEVFVGFFYLSMAYASLQIFLGNGAKSSDQSTEIWIAQILAIPYGKWIIFMTSAVLLIIGGYQFYTVYTAGFEYQFDVSRMSSKQEKSLRQLGRIGISAWGIVYFIIAYLFYQAARNTNPKEAGGLGDALNALSHHAYGAWMLGIISSGLIIYGIYVLILSYYHEIYG